MTSIASDALVIVAYNGCLDIQTLDEKIRPLSKEFQEIGTKSMTNHPLFVKNLCRLNANFKLHYCTCCNKPYVHVGFWSGDLCNCKLIDTEHGQELVRRANLSRAKDPRQNSSFLEKSPKARFLVLFKFCVRFGTAASWLVGGSRCLFCVSALPLVSLGVIVEMKVFNETALQLLSTCVILSTLQKELQSVGTHCVLTNMALAAFVDEEKATHFLSLLDDEAFLDGHLGLNDFDSLQTLMNDAFFDVLGLHVENGKGTTLFDTLKNIGNSVGKYVTSLDIPAFLPNHAVQAMLNDVPGTFV